MATHKAKKKLILSEERIARIRRSRLMDDEYMRKFFSGDKECIQLVLRIILGRDDLTVISCRVQRTMRGSGQFRSIRLDVHAVDSTGRGYDIEVQRGNEGADPRRARFHSALMDANMLKKNENFKALNESYVIFITVFQEHEGGT